MVHGSKCMHPVNRFCLYSGLYVVFFTTQTFLENSALSCFFALMNIHFASIPASCKISHKLFALLEITYEVNLSSSIQFIYVVLICCVCFLPAI